MEIKSKRNKLISGPVLYVENVQEGEYLQEGNNKLFNRFTNRKNGVYNKQSRY